MKYATKCAALFALMSFAVMAIAADEKPAGDRHNVLHGKITKIDGNAITISVGKGDAAKEVVVQTDDKTAFTVDHQAAKLADLKVGEVAAVGPAEGVAHHVDINTGHRNAEGHAVIHGIVSKVDGKAITVTIGKGDKAKEVVVQTDDNTKFTVDHADAKLEDVKDGELVAIAPASGVAQHVDLNTSHKK